MSDRFFISFNNEEEARDFYEVLTLMNKQAGYLVVKVQEDVEIKGHHGLLIINLWKNTWYNFLWRKYFMLSHGHHPSVYFWDEEYEKDCESQEAAEVATA